MDTNSFWVLLDVSPVTWKELVSEPPPPETLVHGKIEMFWGTINAEGRPLDIKLDNLICVTAAVTGDYT